MRPTVFVDNDAVAKRTEGLTDIAEFELSKSFLCRRDFVETRAVGRQWRALHPSLPVNRSTTIVISRERDRCLMSLSLYLYLTGLSIIGVLIALVIG